VRDRALHTGGSTIDPATEVEFRFGGAAEVTIAAGVEVVSDPIELRH
jgi:hypothetical protein